MSTPQCLLNYPTDHPSNTRIEDLLRRAGVSVVESYFAADYMIEAEGFAFYNVQDSRRIIFCNPRNIRSTCPQASIRVDLETGNLLRDWNLQSIPFAEFWKTVPELISVEL